MPLMMQAPIPPMFKVFKSRLGKRYLYESSTNTIFEADDESLTALGSVEGDTSLLRRLGDDFYSEYFSDVEGAAFSLLRDDMVPGEATCPEILVLELTQQCNFRCEYCIYSGKYHFERTHSSIQMNEGTIDLVCAEFFEGKRHPDYVSFYGGEPLLCFDLIRRLCDKLEGRGIRPKYSITTNGSLVLRDSVLQFLYEHDFHINMSYDGLNHDRYRRMTNGAATSGVVMRALETIAGLDEDYFASNVTISATLAPPYQLLDNYHHFSQHRLLSRLGVSVNLVNEGDNSFMDGFDLSEQRSMLARDARCLADEYITYEGSVPKFLISLFASSALRIDDREMSLQTHSYPPGQCVVGGHRLFVTATGKKFTCERVGNYGCLGRLGEDKKDIAAYERVIGDMSDYFDSHCQSCHLVRVCDMCCSALRRGSALKDDELASQECEDRRRWYDMIFYVYLSRKELGKGVFGD